MVRTIDGDERRELLVTVVWELMRRGGLEAASVRAVATAAGISAGSVRHFFTTQDELHVFAMEELIRRMTERVQQALDSVSPDPADSDLKAAKERVLAGLMELLPLDEESSADFLVHLQFIAKAMVHPPLAPVAEKSQRALNDFSVRCVTYLADLGGIRDSVDVTARRLAVVMDGLVLRRLTAPYLLSADEMTGILRDHVDSLSTTASSS